MPRSDLQKVGVIGAGMVAKTHIAALSDLSDTLDLVGIYSRSAGRAQQMADAYTGQTTVFADLASLCEQVDWAIVLTPPNARIDIVTALANAGCGVLLEKPIERDLTAATQIVEICAAAGVPLGVCFQHRMRQASRDLTAQIASGKLGPLALVEVIVPWWRPQSYYDEPGRGTYARDGGGVLISQAIHSLDLMLTLTGPVSEVQAMAHTTALHRMESEDYVTAGLRFANGAAGTLVASTASYPGDAETITLHFEQAVATLHAGTLHLNWRGGDTESFGETAGTGGGADPMAFSHAWHRDVIADFAASFAAKAPPAITGQDALQVHRLIAALIQSSHEKRAITLPQTEG